MTQNEFIEQLRQALSRNGVRDIDGVTVTYLEHFIKGKAVGRDEDAIAAELGDPNEIAARYAAANKAPEGGEGYVYAEDSRGNPRAGAYAKPAGASTPYDGQYAGAAVQSGYVRSETAAPGQGADTHGINIVLLVVLAIFVAVPAFFAILGALIGIWAAAFGVGAGSIVLFVTAFAEMGVMTGILILFAISLAALSALLFIGAVWLSRLFAIGIRGYVRWNRQLAKGGTLA